MSEEINYKNNPLHGLSLKPMLTEIVDHYGFEILYAYLGINSFQTNPSVDSSVKFLKKTDWAREKVESFYLYKFKSLPKVAGDQFELPPRDRIVPEGQVAGEPADLSIEDADRLQEERDQRAADYDAKRRGPNAGAKGPAKSYSKPYDKKPRAAAPKQQDASTSSDPWANSRAKFK